MMAFRKHILVAVASLLGVVVMSVPGEVQAQEVEELAGDIAHELDGRLDLKKVGLRHQHIFCFTD